MVLRVGFVREHFSSPLLQFAEKDEGKTFTLVESPGGTGQLIKRLENDEIDLAIALTDPLIAGIVKGSPYKLVGTYVTSPLNWAVSTSTSSKYNSISDLKGSIIGISRIGSGSQTMALVMALQQGWKPSDIDFKVCSDIHGLVAAVNDGSISAFMWEWFTTKPWADSGEVRFIGSVPTPWHSWMIASHNDQNRAPDSEVSTFITELSKYVTEFDSPAKREKDDVEFIREKFEYKEEDIRSWLSTVKYPDDIAHIWTDSVYKTIDILATAGAIPPVKSDGEKWAPKDFVKSSQGFGKLTEA